MSIFKRIKQIHNQIGIVRYLLNRFINKYHIIELKRYRGMWIDFDTKILYACFQELCNVVEKEKIFEVTDWGDCAKVQYKDTKDKYNLMDEKQYTRYREEIEQWKKYYKETRKIAKEIRFLYDWWQYRDWETGI